MSPTLTAVPALKARLAEAKAALPAGEPKWLAAARTAALSSFETQGAPTPRRGDWRFTPTAPLMDTAFAPAERPERRGAAAGKALCPLAFHQIVLENGRVSRERSILSDLPKGVTVQGMAEALGDSPEALRPFLERLPDGLPLAALAASLFRDGVFIRVGRGVRLDRPIHIVEASAPDASRGPAMAHLRSLIVLEPGAEAEIVTESLGEPGASFWTNALCDVELGENASLKHYRLQREAASGVRTAATVVRVGRSARYESHVFTLGGALVREDLRVAIAGEGADCALNGLSLLHGAEIADHHTIVTHEVVGGTTRELYKAVLDEKSRFIFDGLIEVRPGAQKTDAQVYNRNLLLSEDASVNTNPEFKILADDVSCKHGGAIGQLSPEALFYLRSRGVDSNEARRLLVYAFGSEMVERVKLEPLRLALESALRARMPEAGEALL